MNDQDFKLFAKKPVAYYATVICVLLLLLFLLFKEWDLSDIGLFILIFVLVYYYFFLRFACEIYVQKDSVKIHYMMPWIQDEYIVKCSVNNVDYLTSFWDMQSSYKQSRNFKNVCFDTIVISKSDGSVEEININTRYTYFHKLLDYLNVKN